MKDLAEHAERKKDSPAASKHPVMRAPSANPGAIRNLEREIRNLERQLDGEVAVVQPPLPESQQIARDPPPATAKVQSQQRQPVRAINIPERPEEGEEPPSNEREARLRQRLLERMSRKGSGGGGTPSAAAAAGRPATAGANMTPSNKDQRKSQLYVEQPAAAHNVGVGAWGEHGMGLPFLAKEPSTSQKCEKEKNEVDYERRKREEQEKRERKVREARVLERRMRGEREAEEEEERRREREREVVVKDPFVDVRRGDREDADTDSGEGTEGEEEEKERGGGERGGGGGGRGGGGGNRTTMNAAAANKTSNVRAQNPNLFEASPPRRRGGGAVWDKEKGAGGVHASTKPRQSGVHNLYKVFGEEEGGGASALDSHRAAGRGGGAQRPATAADLRARGGAGRGADGGADTGSGCSVRNNFLLWAN